MSGSDYRLVTDKTEVMDGWFIDDVAVAKMPQSVVLSPLFNASYDSLDLAWTQSLDDNFAAYEIYRGKFPGRHPVPYPGWAITDPAVTAFTDTGLSPDTVYYYRVFTVNTLDIAVGSKEENGLTLPPMNTPGISRSGPGGRGGWMIPGMRRMEMPTVVPGACPTAPGPTTIP